MLFLEFEVQTFHETTIPITLMCLAFAATHGCIDLRLRVANIGLSDDGACEEGSMRISGN